MKYFKKGPFWGLFSVVVFAGSLWSVNFNYENQYIRIPDVSAQGSNSVYDSQIFPSDIIFSNNGRSQDTRAGISPHDVMFAPARPTQKSHPGSIIFENAFPGDIIISGSNGNTEMRTIMTCSGCNQTMATCNWDCGPTFSYCNPGNIYGDSFTSLICPGPTGLICGSGGITNIFCTSGFCGSGGNTLMTCSSGGIFCTWGGGNTSRTCYVFGCRVSNVYTGSVNTFITCSSLYGVCGRQTGGIYGWSIPFEATSPPPF